MKNKLRLKRQQRRPNIRNHQLIGYPEHQDIAIELNRFNMLVVFPKCNETNELDGPNFIFNHFYLSKCFDRS